MKSLVWLALLAGTTALAWWLRPTRTAAPEDPPRAAAEEHTVQSRLRQFGRPVRERLSPHFARAGVSYPPARIVLLACKQERRLELYAAAKSGPFRFIRDYPILAASGGPGPKLREGDHQVPEGFYGIELLNPNSLFHVSLRIGYPNAFDRDRAAEENRTDLGGDIMIHGSAVSIGCLAMGDPVAEELFALAALTGPENVRVILSPVDFRSQPAPLALPPDAPPWTPALHEQLRAEIAQLRR